MILVADCSALVSDNELKILEQAEYVDDDTYLRSIEGMVQSILDARREPIENVKSMGSFEKPYFTKLTHL